MRKKYLYIIIAAILIGLVWIFIRSDSDEKSITVYPQEGKFIVSVTIKGELDYLLIDLPPGTSDIHLTLVQTVSVTGSIIVSTPQEIAIADAIKGVNMFRSDKINVPVLGLIENMSWFTPEELPDNKYYIFGKDGGKELAKNLNAELLGQIPIVQSIRENGDSGKPSALNENSIVGKEFLEIAEKVKKQVSTRNFKMDPTRPVEMDDNAGCSTN